MDCYLETCYRGPWSREHFLDGDGRAAAQVLEVNLKMIYENSISTYDRKLFQHSDIVSKHVKCVYWPYNLLVRPISAGMALKNITKY